MSSVFLQELMVAGNLTRDPKRRDRPAGGDKPALPIAYCAVAVNFWKGGNKLVNFYDLSFYGDNAETISQYGYKGMNVMVRGKPDGRTYTDKTGVERPSWAISVGALWLLAKKQGDIEVQKETVVGTSVLTASEQTTMLEVPQKQETMEADDLPF